jgi:Ser/Thr protein kinase RdoA (MazF antagonist)
MSLDVFPAQYSTLSSHALVDWTQSNYELPSPIGCRLQKMGDDDYLITSRDAKFVLRVYAKSKLSKTEFDAQAQVLNDLAEAGLPVLEPVRNKAGAYVEEFNAIEGKRYGTLYHYVDGAAPGFNIDEQQAFAYGKAVARIHNWGNERRAVYARWHIDLASLLDVPLAVVTPFLEHRTEDISYLQDLAEKLKRQIAGLPTTLPEYGLCHGDLRKRNFLIDDQQQLTIMDWDCVGYGWRAYDVVVLRWSIGPAMGPAGLGEHKTEQVYAAYLQGYATIRILSAAELAVIPYFVAARVIWVAGQEIGQQQDRAWGTSWINDAYFDGWIASLKHWVAEHCTFDSEAADQGGNDEK